MKVPETLQSVWKSAVEKGANEPFIKLPSVDGASLISYKRSSFLARALRYTEVFRRELALLRGARILMLGVDLSELPIMMHGLWLGGFVAVPVDDETPPDALQRIIAECRIDVVVFPPSSAARVSQLITSVGTVQRWIVTGGGVAPAGGGLVLRVEELLSRVGGVKFDVPIEGNREDEALITFSKREGRAILLSQGALLEGAARWRGATQELLHGTLIESSVVPHSLPTIQFSFLLPLLAPVVPVVRREREEGRVWEQMVADSIGCTLFSQETLFEVLRKPKPRALTIPSTSRIVVLTDSVLSHDLLRILAEKVGVRALSSYWVTEAGGLVALSSVNASEEWNRNNRLIRVPPVVGSVCEGVELTASDDGLLIQSVSRMVRYEMAGKGGMTFTKKGELVSGDDGEILSDGTSVLVAVAGRRNERVSRRKGFGYASAVDGVVRTLRGIEWARTVVLGDENSASRMLGTFVAAVRMSNLTEDEVLQAIRNSLPEPYWPERLVLVKGLKGGIHPSDEELRKMF